MGLIATAVYVAPDRRRMLIVGTTGIVLSMLAIAATLAALWTWYINNGAPEIMTVEAALTIARTLLVPLRTMVRMVVVAGLVVVTAAFLTGPSPAARGLRSVGTRAAASLRDRAERDRQPTVVEMWTGANRTPLRVAVVAAAVLVLLLWDYPSAAVVLTLAVCAAALMVLIELVGHRAPGPHPDEATLPDR